MSSLSPRTSHSIDEFKTAFQKLNFTLVKEEEDILYYQDPDTAIQIIQNSENLNMKYVCWRLEDLGLSYKIFRWLIGSGNLPTETKSFD